MSVISSTTKSYISGFLDGDGSIIFQLVRRKDYRYGYQIRASIVFYQKTIYKSHLEWIKSILKVGYLRDRNDGMSEYTIVGIPFVSRILRLLKPYVVLKKPQLVVALKIDEVLKNRIGLEGLIEASKLVDEFANMNYSKKRTNTSSVFINYLKEHNLYPCND
jgi:intein-encoded DNA endonuclease-like protein